MNSDIILLMLAVFLGWKNIVLGISELALNEILESVLIPISLLFVHMGNKNSIQSYSAIWTLAFFILIKKKIWKTWCAKYWRWMWMESGILREGWRQSGIWSGAGKVTRLGNPSLSPLSLSLMLPYQPFLLLNSFLDANIIFCFDGNEYRYTLFNE